MKKLTRILTLVLAVMMLFSVLPTAAFAAQEYDVFLNHGPQGWGSEAWPLHKTQGQALPLLHTRDDIFATYGMLPGYYVLNDQRVFIEWNTSFDARTGRGTGNAYYDSYTADTPATLYAIWGYNIQLNADGGVFPATGNGVYLTYVANFNNSNYEDPLTDYQYCFPDYFDGAPTKPGCRRVMYNGNYAYGLLRNDLQFFTWEGPGQNLTIPPTGGAMPWSAFHCVNTHRGLALEFVAIWEPSITYDANGGSGYMDVDYLEFTYDALWNYEYYSVKNCAYSKAGTYFTGWNTKPDGSGVSVAPGTAWGGQMTNSDPITLYAQWADGSTGHTHSYSSAVTKYPTCTETGVRTYKCACGSAYNEAIAALGHSTTTSTTPATCTSDGKTITTCTRCAASVTTAIPALGHNYTTTTTSATCTTEGKTVSTCRRCGDSTTTTTPALGHSFGDWAETLAPTTTTVGKEERSCSVCGSVETRDVPMLDPEPTVGEPYLSAYGVQLTVHDLYDIKDYFIAEGDYDTYREVKNNMVVSIGAAKLGIKTEYTYTLPHHGRHTVYIRYNDGSFKVLKIDIVGNEPEFDENGLQLTIRNLGDVKVIRTAYGEYNTVGTLKRAATHRAFTQSAIKGNESYKIQYRTNGIVTVAVCYNDGYTEFYYYNVEQKVPTMVQSGNTVTFGELEGLYNIRYAPGEWATSSQIKAALGSKALKASSIDENGYITVTLNPGTYTFCVQFDDESYNYYRVTVE